MFIFILYDNVRCPAFYHEEDLLYILEYTDDFLSLLFKSGYSKEDQIKLFKDYLDFANQVIREGKKYKPEENIFNLECVGYINYWTSVLGLLRYKIIKDDGKNGFARAIPEKRFKQTLKDKLKAKMIRIKN